jgi:hypothetical protein
MFHNCILQKAVKNWLRDKWTRLRENKMEELHDGQPYVPHRNKKRK